MQNWLKALFSDQDTDENDAYFRAKAITQRKWAVILFVFAILMEYKAFSIDGKILIFSFSEENNFVIHNALFSGVIFISLFTLFQLPGLIAKYPDFLADTFTRINIEQTKAKDERLKQLHEEISKVDNLRIQAIVRTNIFIREARFFLERLDRREFASTLEEMPGAPNVNNTIHLNRSKYFEDRSDDDILDEISKYKDQVASIQNAKTGLTQRQTELELSLERRLVLNPIAKVLIGISAVLLDAMRIAPTIALGLISVLHLTNAHRLI
ncbi:hypothetical protein HAD_04915 [Hyphomonas adhaerens MHS-3]|uniref:Uncharacterized protein n=1 Tax=Hyphomonas adhaerens MHS-3 TaxID=1280949 RepID=A0A069E8Z6_9PROT|nr:hypothetical protein [Hyphomonas adhaerens]KCZ84996.1 hypothetical protein HAD_04915 [Hyphomonas adhaerens MHS-3]